jgi:hypothetical protein
VPNLYSRAQVADRYGTETENASYLRFRSILRMQEFFDSIRVNQWKLMDAKFVGQSEEFAIARFKEWVIEQIT